MTDKPDKPDKPTPPVDYLALRSQLISAIRELERVMESSGTPVESVIVTRRERSNLTRRRKKR